MIAWQYILAMEKILLGSALSVTLHVLYWASAACTYNPKGCKSAAILLSEKRGKASLKQIQVSFFLSFFLVNKSVGLKKQNPRHQTHNFK